MWFEEPEKRPHTQRVSVSWAEPSGAAAVSSRDSERERELSTQRPGAEDHSVAGGGGNRTSTDCRGSTWLAVQTSTLRTPAAGELLAAFSQLARATSRGS
ncbi:hypothetical protein Q8A73_003943 [Channa argus]|nr:hypothetical protein Q8A73_003943 [Channa argus]